MDSLFGFTTTAVMVEKEPPPAEPEPFKIPMKIAERVMNNCYYGDGTVHPGDHLLFLHELCELFKCAGMSMDDTSKTYLLSRTLLLLFPLYLVCFWMKLTRTNAVFSRIALVSSLCAETRLSGKYETNL